MYFILSLLLRIAHSYHAAVKEMHGKKAILQRPIQSSSEKGLNYDTNATFPYVDTYSPKRDHTSIYHCISQQ